MYEPVSRILIKTKQKIGYKILIDTNMIVIFAIFNSIEKYFFFSFLFIKVEFH